MREVLVGVLIIGQRHLREIGHRCGDDPLRRPLAREQLPHERRKHEVALASHHIVGQLHDGLASRLVTHLRAAEHHGQIRAQLLEHGDELGGRRNIPDVHAQRDDLGLQRQQALRHVERAMVQCELDQRRARPQLAEVGQQVAQAKRGVDVFRVERRQDDIRHPRQRTAGRRHAKPQNTHAAGDSPAAAQDHVT
ncbi:MAG: hypothetical protein BWX86_02495 [Verrucomicrobia bacterium ADurb.Bin122]|nr:MAG: hypothetical protein BWX86_02495 [Verrucomicrobia bacterium ADurb.Bin122]